jgi:hypothetical protein
MSFGAVAARSWCDPSAPYYIGWKDGMKGMKHNRSKDEATR